MLCQREFIHNCQYPYFVAASEIITFPRDKPSIDFVSQGRPAAPETTETFKHHFRTYVWPHKPFVKLLLPQSEKATVSVVRFVSRRRRRGNASRQTKPPEYPENIQTYPHLGCCLYLFSITSLSLLLQTILVSAVLHFLHSCIVVNSWVSFRREAPRGRRVARWPSVFGRTTLNVWKVGPHTSEPPLHGTVANRMRSNSQNTCSVTPTTGRCGELDIVVAN